ncbi:hypothetical protein ACFQHO_53490 [Actinomadura yumaensis]
MAETVERVTFNNGSIAVRKVVHEPVEADMEVLTSWLGRTIGARVPAVHQTGPTEIYMELVPGVPAAQVFTSRAEAEPLITSPEGLKIGLLDILANNRDRNYGNWLVHQGRLSGGIDHSVIDRSPPDKDRRTGQTRPGSGAKSMFAAYWFAGLNASFVADWKDHPLDPADIDRWLHDLDAGQARFTDRGYDDWFAGIRARLYALRDHAKGPSS